MCSRLGLKGPSRASADVSTSATYSTTNNNLIVSAEKSLDDDMAVGWSSRSQSESNTTRLSEFTSVGDSSSVIQTSKSSRMHSGILSVGSSRFDRVQVDTVSAVAFAGSARVSPGSRSATVP
jgi:hypothetical protein